MRKALLIFNPTAGKGAIKQNLYKVVDALTKEGYELMVYPTQNKGDGYRYMIGRHHYDLLVISGGDGTLREIISGYLANGKLHCPVAYLPAGTTNDFAKTLNIAKDFNKSLLTACMGQPQPVDIGRFNQENFIYIAAFGAFTEVSYSTPQFNKNLLGHFAYILEGITQLSQIKSYYCTITSDDEVIEGEFLFGMISNSDSVGGIKRKLGPKAELSDGLFEGCFIRKPTQLQDLHKIIANLLNGQVDGEQVVMLRTRKLVVSAAEPIRWTLDGEDGGYQKRAEITNLPSAIRMIMDPPEMSKKALAGAGK